MSSNIHSRDDGEGEDEGNQHVSATTSAVDALGDRRLRYVHRGVLDSFGLHHERMHTCEP